MNATPLRVLVAGHDLKFFHRLRAALQDSGRFVFREDPWEGHDRHDEQRSRELLAWAQVVVCEWCLGNAVWYSNHIRSDQRLLVRFHRVEIRTPFPYRLDLNGVSRIVFVGSHLERDARALFGWTSEKTCVIHNLVDVDHFDRGKLAGSFFNLGLLGMAPKRKRLDRALDTLASLQQVDDRYTLRVKGPLPSSYNWVWREAEERAFFEQQWDRLERENWGKSVVFDPPGDDVADWFRTVGFILSPSDDESFHMSVAEGMAAGSLPVIWDWEGVSGLYPVEYVVTSSQEAADRIESLRSDVSLEKRQTRLREYVRTRFGRDVVREQWRALLQGEAEG